MLSLIKLKLLSFSLILIISTPLIANPIVINEIHYDENDKTIRAEFIELYNNSEESVNISQWYFSDGIDYTFKEGTAIESGAYLVIAESPKTIDELFNYSNALGPFANNTGLRILERRLFSEIQREKELIKSIIHSDSHGLRLET